MINLRQRHERGKTRLDGLESYHTFSFGEYQDPLYPGFGDLKVINDDRIAPGQGFAPHSHPNTEILTYVLEGTLAHKDSQGQGALIRAGEVQLISGWGDKTQHAEFNPSDTEPVHFLQIWIHPQSKTQGLNYQKIRLNPTGLEGDWLLVASPDARENSLKLHQDAEVWLARLGPSQALGYELPPERAAWLQVMHGVLQVNGRLLEAGDGVAVTDEDISLEGVSRVAEVLLFNVKHP